MYLYMGYMGCVPTHWHQPGIVAINITTAAPQIIPSHATEKEQDEGRQGSQAQEHPPVKKLRRVKKAAHWRVPI